MVVFLTRLDCKPKRFIFFRLHFPLLSAPPKRCFGSVCPGTGSALLDTSAQNRAQPRTRKHQISEDLLGVFSGFYSCIPPFLRLSGLSTLCLSSMFSLPLPGCCTPLPAIIAGIFHKANVKLSLWKCSKGRFR